MTRSALKYRFCYSQIDQQTVARFLSTQKKELYLPDDTAVQQVVDLAFEKGGVFAGFDQQKNMQSMMGFFFGDPTNDFVEKELAFMYVATIAKNYRLTRAFHVGLKQVLESFSEMGLSAIRMQARATDKYVNKLYGRFAQPLSTGFSLRGQPVITYGGSIDDALAYFRPKKATTEFRHIPARQSYNNAKHAAGLMPIQF
ncbi:MAG: hypothetical protein AB8G95_11320 [Anaerolineae bacterium]